ncbi:probable cyclin-dependent serine/threonine-protein kinase DDB_G0278487 [Diabrotica virgifera virgifera]|uniref:Uncharacterized protein n=1 Tax=Diabrotica virgifera virgifera TaxID=50390 RepID=A0ABM5KXM7_DIAVI|nr:probable cyclin-dependent serine/threonine-protein kinase DDB_G0278487 [Diabrotica virgifera virgifera]
MDTFGPPAWFLQMKADEEKRRQEEKEENEKRREVKEKRRQEEEELKEKRGQKEEEEKERQNKLVQKQNNLKTDLENKIDEQQNYLRLLHQQIDLKIDLENKIKQQQNDLKSNLERQIVELETKINTQASLSHIISVTNIESEQTASSSFIVQPDTMRNSKLLKPPTFDGQTT